MGGHDAIHAGGGGVTPRGGVGGGDENDDEDDDDDDDDRGVMPRAIDAIFRRLDGGDTDTSSSS